MKRFTKMLDTCVVTFRKATSLTYHVTIINNYGGLKRFEIIGCGNSLEQAIDDACFVYDNCSSKIKMRGKEWQYKITDSKDQ